MKNFLLLTLLFLAACTTTPKSPYTLITPSATPETQRLFEKLASLQGQTVLIGQQSPMTRSRIKTTDAEFGNCDMVHSVGDYPVVFGFDLGWGYERLIPEIMAAVEKGAIITFSCHWANADTKPGDKDAYRTQLGNDVKKVLPSGENHQYLLNHLDSVANLASKITYNGVKVPVIFRPWHEHTGGWFWWGTNSCTAEEFVALWRFTVEYLRDTKGVDNFIYAYSPSLNLGADSYEVRNPGAEWMDIAGFDCYSADGEASIEQFTTSCELTAKFAQKHFKVPACTEFGFERCMAYSENEKWFTTGVLEPIRKSALSSNIVYALTWANFDEVQWWVPIKGDKTYDDFVEFCADPYTSLLQEWHQIYEL